MSQLRRLMIDIELADNNGKQPRYDLAITSSDSGHKITESIMAGKLLTLVDFAIQDALNSIDTTGE